MREPVDGPKVVIAVEHEDNRRRALLREIAEHLASVHWRQRVGKDLDMP